MNTQFKNEWKFACPRCGQEQADIARMKRHYARVRPCMGVYNCETKKYEGQPILDIPWKVLQDGVGVVSRKSKVAQKKAKEAELKQIEEMTYENCPLIVEEYAFLKDGIVEKLLKTFLDTFIKTGFITKMKLFPKSILWNGISGKNIKKEEHDVHQLMKNFMFKVEDYIKLRKNLFTESEIDKYKNKKYYCHIEKVLCEKIQYHLNIKNSLNDPITDHLPFYIKFNYILDLFPVYKFSRANSHLKTNMYVFSRRTLYIHHKITGEVIGYFEFKPEEWDDDGFLRSRDWGGCPNLFTMEILH